MPAKKASPKAKSASASPSSSPKKSQSPKKDNKKAKKASPKAAGKKKAGGDKPKSGYANFVAKHYQDADIQKLDSKERFGALGAKWKKLSEAEKKKY
jgi:hypothetical protein